MMMKLKGTSQEFIEILCDIFFAKIPLEILKLDQNYLLTDYWEDS